MELPATTVQSITVTVPITSETDDTDISTSQLGVADPMSGVAEEEEECDDDQAGAVASTGSVLTTALWPAESASPSVEWDAPVSTIYCLPFILPTRSFRSTVRATIFQTCRGLLRHRGPVPFYRSVLEHDGDRLPVDSPPKASL